MKRLRLLPIPAPSPSLLVRCARQPGWNAGAANTRLQFAAEAATWQERREHLERAAEYERREQAARLTGVDHG